jgi:hypothetical protein
VGSLRSVEQGDFDIELFGKLALKWSENDIALAVNFFHDCAIQAHARDPVMAAEGAQSDTKLFEDRLRDIVLRTQNLNAQIAAQKLAQQKERDQEAADEARGYQSITVETFVLDGKDLASKGAKVSLIGVFTREGNLDFLYADRRAVLMATGRYGSPQPSVPLLTQDAAREFRKQLLEHLPRCQPNVGGGCPLTVRGRVITCTMTYALGASRQESCVDVENGTWQ